MHVCFEAKRGDEIAPTRRGVRGERQGFFVGVDRRRRRARALGERRLDVFAVRWVVHPRGEVVDVAKKFPKRRGRALAERVDGARRRASRLAKRIRRAAGRAQSERALGVIRVRASETEESGDAIDAVAERLFVRFRGVDGGTEG